MYPFFFVNCDSPNMLNIIQNMDEFFLLTIFILKLPFACQKIDC